MHLAQKKRLVAFRGLLMRGIDIFSLYDSCMHLLRLPHLKWEAEQVMGGQPFSSVLSKQSLSPSQTHD